MSGQDLNPIEDHPEFPFGDTLAVQRLEAWEESFDPRAEPGTPEGDLLRRFLELVERYGFLERIVQGEIRYELPVHSRFLEQRARSEDPLEQQAAELAEAEADLLGRPHVPSLDLFEAMEDIGVKVVTPSTAPASGVMGGFFFDGEAGPAFLVGVEQDDPRAVFVLAHLLAHYVADFDPYQNRICRWDPDSLENLEETPEEVRADLFARALLIPEDTLRSYLDQLGRAVQTGESSASRSWEILATLFGVPEEVLADRMIDLGFDRLVTQLRAAREEGGPAEGAAATTAGAAAATASGRTTDAEAGAETDGYGASNDSGPGFDLRSAGPFRLPSRYMHLALACFHERIMETDVLARFLDLDEVGTQRIIEMAEMEEGGRVGRSRVDPDPAEGGDPI